MRRFHLGAARLFACVSQLCCVALESIRASYVALEGIMLQHVALSPRRVAVRILGVGILLGVLLVPLPPSYGLQGSYLLLSLGVLVLSVSAGLVTLWKRHQLQLHGRVPVLVLG